MLRDQFVAGINDQSLRKKLLTEPELTFENRSELGGSAQPEHGKDVAIKPRGSCIKGEAESGP